ncbi:MAG TPA: site-2 protease family protein [Candidatus Eisenbacteria bacterium]|nr:site-2 protease family protein [Candidatus Eisenbacteria bacterium]
MNDPVGLILLLPPLLFALTFHEASHGWMALRLGDPTAKLLGRLTLNPLVHLDPLGTLIFIIPPHIGWAKPVPVDVRYLKHPRRDMMWIALAGPVSNVILAFVFGMILRGISAAGHDFSSPVERALVNMVAWSVLLNLSLAAFNMIPIFPLDGSKVLTGLLSPMAAARFQQLEPMGPMLLLGLIVIGSLSGVSLIGRIISPFASTLGSLFTGGIL